VAFCGCIFDENYRTAGAPARLQLVSFQEMLVLKYSQVVNALPWPRRWVFNREPKKFGKRAYT
jgi:hypothetical protein